MKQDRSARALAPSVALDRVAAKASAHYKAADWDMVDAAESGVAEVESMPSDELPSELRSLSKKERKRFVEKKAQERKKLKVQIKKLSKEREAFIAQKRKESTSNGKDTFEDAVIEALQAQARKKGFGFQN